jgi:uncharacterized protein (DUF885 family)
MTGASKMLADVCESYWAFQCEEAPLTAFFAGHKMPKDALLREAPADHERRAVRAKALLQDLERVSPTALSRQERSTLTLLQRELSNIVRDFDVKTHMRPSLFPLGPDFPLCYWADATTLKSQEDAQLYVQRLKLVRPAFEGVQASMTAGVDAGVRYSRHDTHYGSELSRGMASVPPRESKFFGPFLRAGAAYQDLAAEAEKIIADDIAPAWRAYADFVANDLGEVARDSIACTADLDGQRFYACMVERFTTVQDSPEAIHVLGLSEVKRVRDEMKAVARDAGFETLEDLRHSIATDNSQIAGSAEELREQIEILSKRIDARIPEFFGRTPRTTYGVRLIPAAASATQPPAYAQPNPADNSAAGVNWVNSLPEKVPRYMHVPLALHEAWPGHLMHLALMQEMDELPAFRRFGAMKYSACLEGWALYCEWLGEDMGFYDTHVKRYGRLDMEMWRACRLVVDTGIHSNGWSRQQAIDFMRENLAIPMPTIESEVDRYIAMPGQALSYQLGNLKIRELRARAEERLGPRFRIRDFHDALMAAGPVTLPVLDDIIGDWIEAQAGAVAA